MTPRPRRFRFPGRVYAIVDTGVRGRTSLLELTAALLEGGVRVLQLRAKDLSTRELCDLARTLRPLCTRREALFLVNDRPDVARLVGADGVHLGQSDLPPRQARRIVGEDAIIGLSTHNLAQVREADRLDSVDYIGFGPLFATTSKSDTEACQGIEGLRAARSSTSLPLTAIGGLSADSAAEALAAGADAVAMIGALARAEDPAALVRALEAMPAQTGG